MNRFRDSWYDVHVLHSFWRVTETTKSVHAFMKTPGAFGTASACAEVKPEMLEAVQLKMQQTKQKATVQGILQDTDTPQVLRTASLIVIVQGEECRFEPDVEVSYREMTQRVACDPVGQSIVFELMIRLFFIHVLGLRPETVGWQRGEVRKRSQHWVSDGLAADLMGVPTIFGPIAAAFGAVEAQGRGSLHPHILVWLLQAQLQVLLEMLQRERDAFQGRLSLWMREVARAVVATQHSAVTELPTYLQGGSNEAEVAVPPLPFGPTEKRYYAADGGVETATAEQLIPPLGNDIDPPKPSYLRPRRTDRAACREA